MDYRKAYDGKVEGFVSMIWISIASRIAMNSKNASTKSELIAYSSKYVDKLSDQEEPYGFTYHALIVNANGNSDEAKGWIEKVQDAAKSMSKDDQESVAKFIDSIAKTIK
jgi:hypothetical protein